MTKSTGIGVVARSLSWAMFATVAADAAKIQLEPSVIKGIKELGPDYSLAEDEKLDSLGIVEVIMKLEELLEEKLGNPFKIPDQLEEKAKNIGEAYILTCRANGIEPEPDFSKPPDLSSFEPWLEEQAKKKAR